MRESLFETLVGLVVVAVAAIFLVFSLKQGATAAPTDSYQLHASFNRIDGVAAGSDVRLAGVKIGVVSSVALDPKTYKADITFTVPRNLKVPDDSTAQVQSDGLLGGAYLSLVVGGSFDYVAPNGRLEYTRGSVDLLTVLSSAVSGITSKSDNGDAGAKAAGDK